MYQLIALLNSYTHRHSVYPFGEIVHYTDQRADFDPEMLHSYLSENSLANIHIAPTTPTIEDTFMELAR